MTTEKKHAAKGTSKRLSMADLRAKADPKGGVKQLIGDILAWGGPVSPPKPAAGDGFCDDMSIAQVRGPIPPRPGPHDPGG